MEKALQKAGVGKAEERSRVDRAVVCSKSLIWFEGMPTVV